MNSNNNKKNNIREIIEPAFKHEVRADVEVRKTNNQLLGSVMVPANFERYPVQFHKAAAEKPAVEAVTPNENDQLINKGKAVYNKCIQVLNKMGFPQDQGSQLCQLLTETMIMADQEQNESNNQQQQPSSPNGNSKPTEKGGLLL